MILHHHESPTSILTNRPDDVKAGGVKPYVRCPSAMLCVQRVNCDFDGSITEDLLDIGPDLEMLRVPLIVSLQFSRQNVEDQLWSLFQPCVNRKRGNAIDVCCRDPNYVDPWPMDNKNNNNNNNNNNKNQQQEQQSPSQNILPSRPRKAGRNNLPTNIKPKRKNAYG